MFTKYILSHHIGDMVEFETKYYKGTGEIRSLATGRPGIVTDKFIFYDNEIKKLRVIK
jgi:hypothetical protein